MTERAFHAIADIFPLMDGQPMADLITDIQQHGLREPIWLYEGQILDGRNRYRACLAAGVEPVFVDFNGDYDQAYRFSISLNLHRRHLTDDQRKTFAADDSNVNRGELNQYTEKSNNGYSNRSIQNNQKTTRTDAAELWNVPVRGIEEAKRIKKTVKPEIYNLVKFGDLKLAEARRIGQNLSSEQQLAILKKEDPKAVQQAAKEIQAKKKKARRDELSQQKQDYLKAARQEKKKPFPDRCQLIYQDFRVAEIADNSLDRIITDPPYGHDYIPVYRDLAQFAVRTLKPDGVMLVMCGQMWFPEFLNQLIQSELHYQWLMAYLTPGGQSPRLFQRKVNTFWKPVLVFSKGESVPDWFGDVVTSATNDNDKRFHEWGQSESGFRQLVDRFTRPGQTVCDPFMGAGTTLLAALQYGCQVIGIEWDELMFHQASKRLQEAVNRV